MLNHGTPLSTDDVLDIGGMLLRIASRGIVRNRETKRYWERHQGELESQLREIMLKPGTRVIDVDRSSLSRIHHIDQWEVVHEDPASSRVSEIDLSRVRFITFSKYRPEQHILLDAYALQALKNRWDVLPADWKKKDRRPNFIGTRFKKRNPGAGTQYIWCLKLQLQHDGCQGNIIRRDEPDATDFQHEEDHELIAVLLRD